jgi:hypothetical protein
MMQSPTDGILPFYQRIVTVESSRQKFSALGSDGLTQSEWSFI